MTSLTFPAVPVDDGIGAYFREIWKFPLLEAEEEYILAQRFREYGDVDAAHRLVTSHLRLVAKIAMRYRGYGLPVSDLVSEGNIGLMKAVRKFEPERGFRLATYAMWWIKASITEYVLRSWSMVKMGTVAAQKKLFFRLRRIRRTLDAADGGDIAPADVARIATELDVSEQDVVDMDRRLGAFDVSLSAPVSGNDDGACFQDVIADDRPSPESEIAAGQEKRLQSRILARAMANLPERDRLIIEERRLKENPVTLEELGSRLGISRERVRQLENRAFERLRLAVTAA